MTSASARRILVVDDDPAFADALCDILVDDGHLISVVHDGAVALAHIRARAPDIVLCDLHLPGLDGLDLAAAVRGDPGLQRVYLVAMSGFTREADRRRAAASGFDVFLPKPFPAREVQAVIAHAPAR